MAGDGARPAQKEVALARPRSRVVEQEGDPIPTRIIRTAPNLRSGTDQPT